MNKLLSTIIDQILRINDEVWIAGFSGGKDSSLLIDILVEAISKKNHERDLYVIYADTLLEYPMVRKYAYTFLKELEHYANETGLKLHTIIVKPEPGRDFISLQLLRGYPMPHRRFRWCTDKLKIIPARKAIKKIMEENKGKNVALFNGTRFDESAYRSGIMKKRILKCKDCMDLTTNQIQEYNTMQLVKSIGENLTAGLPLFVTKARRFGVGIKVYSPLAYLSEREVWSIIKRRQKPVFTNKPLYKELLLIYGKLGRKYTTKDKVRFGCWLCTVATKDKSGEYFSKIEPKTKILQWARQALFIISHGPDKDMFRNKRQKVKKYTPIYSSLNEKGRKLTNAIYYIVLNEYPEALDSYLEYNEYEKIINTIKSINVKEVIDIVNELLSNYKISEETKRVLKSLLDYLYKITKTNNMTNCNTV